MFLFSPSPSLFVSRVYDEEAHLSFIQQLNLPMISQLCDSLVCCRGAGCVVRMCNINNAVIFSPPHIFSARNHFCRLENRSVSLDIGRCAASLIARGVPTSSHHRATHRAHKRHLPRAHRRLFFSTRLGPIESDPRPGAFTFASPRFLPPPGLVLRW